MKKLIFPFISVTSINAGALFFCLGTIIYGLFGSPTPNHPSIVEAIIGVSMVLASLSGIIDLVRYSSRKITLSPMHKTGLILLLYGFSIPLIISVLAGNPISNTIRDIIPFCFLLLPVLMQRALLSSPNYNAFLFSLVAVGVLFSLRSLIGEGLILSSFKSSSDELLYLANSPAVLFSAIFLFGTGIRMFQSSNNSLLQNKVISILLCLLAVIPFIAMAVALQRAGIGYCLLGVGIIMFVFFIKSPIKILPFIVVICVLPFAFIDVIEEHLSAFMAKTSSVGVNNRLNEVDAVLREINQHPIFSLFGKGWGAEFSSPAVGGVIVNYTHSLITAILLKTGIVGLLLCVIYLFEIAKILLSGIKSHFEKGIIMNMAIGGTLLIGTFLYASYKSMDFGLVLLAASLMAAIKSDQSEQDDRSKRI